MFSKNRTGRRGGGVALYVRDEMHPTPISLITVPSHHEIVWVQLRPHRLPRSVSSIFVATLYSPPNNPDSDSLIQHISQAIDDILAKFQQAGIIILGDVNRLNLSQLTNGHGLKQVVDKATRKDAILDKILTNMHSLYSSIELMSPVGCSDHRGVKWLPKVYLVKHANRTTSRTIPPMKESGIRRFGNWIVLHNWSSVTNADDVSTKCDNFYNDLNSAIELFFPSREVKVHCKDKPWITPVVKELIKRRQAAFSSCSPEWSSLKNKVIREIKKAKVDYYKNRIQRLKNQNPSAWFKFVKIATSNSSPLNVIRVPGVEITDSQAIANAINHHFTDISANVPPLDLQQLPAYQPINPSSVMEIHPWKVYCELKKTPVGKSCGPDGVSAKLIREFAAELSSPICDIINTSYREGKVPSQWKRSIVVPVPKKSPPTIDQLRPISLTDHFAKLAELFIYRQLLADIEPNIDPQQYGSRRGNSTAHYLVNLLHFLHTNADRLQTVSTIVVTDFSKAFDLIVNHNIAINKLFTMGARPSLLPWISSFLHGRQQMTRYNGVLSSSLTPVGGVPQGTRLGPAIFLALINDALTDAAGISRWKYVDDITFAESRRRGSCNMMPSTLTLFHQWCLDNGLRINSSKCKSMRVSFSRTELPPLHLELDDTTLQEVKELKLLGVILQHNLRWDSHVRDITGRASRKFYIIRALKRYRAPVEDLLTIYTCYIRPVLEYCVPVWNSSITSEQANDIERVQRRALRIIFHDRYHSYEHALQISGLQSLSDRREHLCLRFAESLYKHFRDWLPEMQSTNRRLRHSDRLRDFKCRTERLRHSTLPYLTVNRIPERRKIVPFIQPKVPFSARPWSQGGARTAHVLRYPQVPQADESEKKETNLSPFTTRGR
eukprot:XP_011668662.1 PREDICTED: RNA-directed DNA polymerase from mobile element jockey-like [Strongylocentrotus purpuratus]